MTDVATALLPFWDPAALAIVGGGTVLATAMRTPMAELRRAGAALRVLGRRPFAAAPAIEQVHALQRIAKRHGLLALDRSVIGDPDIADAVALAVDGGSAEEIAALAADRRTARWERHQGAIEAWAGAAEVAPAMGLVGTIIGLIRMFASIDDPAALGGAMAVALLTTLYGAVLATLIAMPVAARLRRIADCEFAERARLEAPLAALAPRERPRLGRAA